MSDLCQNCKKHQASLDWVGDGGALALAHGFKVRWCECCAVKEQLKHARERAAAIPDLEEELRTACKEPQP